MSKGYLIFAHNNQEIDYVEIALVNALMIRRHSRVKDVSIVTDRASIDAVRDKHGSIVDQAFQNVILRSAPEGRQTRAFHDGEKAKKLSWHNGSRSTAYDLTPYRETVLLDADYLIQDNTLDHVWGSYDDFLMNRNILTLTGEPPAPQEVRLEPFGIPLYWATCVFFRKGEIATRMFETVEHVRDNYDYYQHLYRFPGGLFRNDYAFSIAAHLIGGWTEGGINSLPCPTLLSSFDTEQLIDASDGLLFVSNGMASRIRGTSVHVMNKFSLARCVPQLLEVYRENV